MFIIKMINDSFVVCVIFLLKYLNTLDTRKRLLKNNNSNFSSVVCTMIRYMRIIMTNII